MAGPAARPRHTPITEVGADGHGHLQSHKPSLELHGRTALWRSSHPWLRSVEAVKAVVWCLLCGVIVPDFAGASRLLIRKKTAPFVQIGKAATGQLTPRRSGRLFTARDCR